MMIHKQIIDHHGRVENVKLFDKDPTIFIKEAKEREEARIKAEKEAEKAKLIAEENGEELPEETKEPAKEGEEGVEEEEEEKEPDYTEFTDNTMTIFEIFEEYGLDSKRLVDEDETKESQKTLYYDFKPFNSKDPILLSGMNRPAAPETTTKKWINLLYFQ